jgi:hypothetical protein
MQSTVAARRIPVRVLTVLAVLLVGLFAAIAPARQAHAGLSERICFWIQTSTGWVRVCIDVPYAIDPHQLWCPGCAVVEFAVADDPVLPDDSLAVVNEAIARGVGQLMAAGVAADPVERTRLMDTAMELFGRAAAALDRAELRLVAVGRGDPERGSFDPRPEPWLTGTGVDLVTGVSQLQRAQHERDPVLAQAWRLGAAGSFESANRLLRR